VSKEKKKRGTGQRSGKKLVPRITIPLDEYEFLRDVVDAARSVSDAYGLSNLRALHCVVAHDITYVRFNNPPPSSAGDPQNGGYVTAIDGDKLREEVVGTGKGVRLYWHRRGEKSLFKFPPIAE